MSFQNMVQTALRMHWSTNPEYVQVYPSGLRKAVVWKFDSLCLAELCKEVEDRRRMETLLST